jgi:hypothetical protein
MRARLVIVLLQLNTGAGIALSGVLGLLIVKLSPLL